MYRAWAEINLDNLAYNMREIKNFVGVECMAIVKAEAYGHGATEISKILLENGADSLGVATCDEGIRLRNDGINADILIMAHSPKARFAEIVEKGLMQTMSDLQMAKDLSKVAQQMQKTASVHIKIDTGMNRIGFKPTDKTIEEIKEIAKLPFLKIEGIFSHLAMAEDKDKSFSYEQHKKLMYIAEKFDYKTHLCNSGGILNNTDLYLDMVRPGLILYGMHPSPDTDRAIDLKPVMALKARISHISTVEAGETVGYDRTFKAERPTRTGTIIIGYADGYPSALSNKGQVIVGNGYAPIIGQICMDQMMIDITDIENVQIEDEVILFGKRGDLELKAEDVALLSECKSREIISMSNVGKRVPRVYIKSTII